MYCLINIESHLSTKLKMHTDIMDLASVHSVYHVNFLINNRRTFWPTEFNKQNIYRSITNISTIKKDNDSSEVEFKIAVNIIHSQNIT